MQKNQILVFRKLIENYLAAITSGKNKHRKVNPVVKSLTGIIKFDQKRDYKKAYTDYLIEKYK